MSQLSTDLFGLGAPDFVGAGPWLNSPPLRLAELRGKVVLVDFWTYSCVNCLRQIPRLRRWHSLYGDLGLVVVGVHTPEFEFERCLPNVSRFVRERGIPYPIVLDNGRRLWEAYGNRYWPHEYLLDARGRIRYDHAGEGAYAQSEMAIRELLTEASPGLRLPPLEHPEELVQPGACFPATPDLYCGRQRGRLGNPGIYRSDEPWDYRAPDELEPGLLYLSGVWEARAEHVRHARPGGHPADFAAVRYQAFEVDAVLGLEGGGEERVLLTRDGRPLSPEVAGRDVVAEGQISYLTVREPRLYNLVRDHVYGSHLLRLHPMGSRVELYTISFGACVGDAD